MSMLKGNDHTRKWTTINAQGEEETHAITTHQPCMHEIYRKFMNLVDLHNKLRLAKFAMVSGACQMLDLPMARLTVLYCPCLIRQTGRASSDSLPLSRKNPRGQKCLLLPLLAAGCCCR